MSESDKTPLLRVREKFGYAVGDFACDLYFMFFIYFAMFFYTDVFGIPAAVVGTMFLVTKLWDSINDPVMGMIADRTETRWGKYRPYILWMLVPFGIVGVLTFTSPELSMGGKIIYAYVTYTLINMVYTALNIPYSALMGVMTSNSKDRTSLSSFRFAAAFAGGICVSGLTLPLASFYGGGSIDVITAKGQADNKIVLAEKGIGTVQIKAKFKVKPDEEAKKKAAWALALQGLFEDLDHVDKTSTVWVKPKEVLLNQLFYEEDGRAKALRAIIELDPQRAIDAISEAAPAGLDVQRMAAETDNGELAERLATLESDVLEQAFMPMEFGPSGGMQLHLDGNFYLQAGFGEKTIDAVTLWDDTAESSDVWADPKKVDWSAPMVSVEVIDQQHGFQFTIGTFAMIAMMLFVITFLSTKERVTPPKSQQVGITKDLKIVFSNKPWLVTAVMSLFTLAQVCIFGAAIMYYFKYYVGIPALGGSFMLVGTISNLLGVFSTSFLTRLYGSKKKVYFFNSLIMVAVMTGFYFPGSDDVAIMFLMTALGGFVSGPLSPIVWAMYADIADHSEWKTGVRATGLFYSAGTFSQKMGWTIGGAVSGWILAWYGFEANIAQTPETIQGIKMLMSFIPASCCLVAGCLVLLYPLDDKIMETIEKELKARRAAEASA